MEAPSSLGQSSRWSVMFCRPNSYLMGSCSFTACSQPSHPFSSPYLQALPCLVSSRKVLAPTGANFPRVASLHERVVLIPFVVLPRVRLVPREAVIQKHRRAPGSRCRPLSRYASYLAKVSATCRQEGPFAGQARLRSPRARPPLPMLPFSVPRYAPCSD